MAAVNPSGGTPNVAQLRQQSNNDTRAAEQRREETDEDGAIQTGDRTSAGRDTKGQGKRQGNHGRRNTAIDVTAEIVEP